MGNLDCQITGGGGGPLEVRYWDSKLEEASRLFNQALRRSNPEYVISVKDSVVKIDHHFLLVHVQDGKIVSVKPVIVPRSSVELKDPSFFKIRARWNTLFYSSPKSLGQIMTINLFSIGMEFLSDLFQFITLDPSVGVGFLYFNINDDPRWVSEITGVFEFSPLEFKLRFPRDKDLTLMLPGIIFVNGLSNHARSYLTMGLEMPLFYNLFGRFKPLRTGFKYLIPMKLSQENDPHFGDSIRFCFFFNYAF